MEISASSSADTPFYAVIVAGGSGTRFGAELPKQYQTIGGKPMILRTIEAFQQCDGLQGICVVIGADHQSLFESIRTVNVDFCTGGDTRNQSVFNGLKFFSKLEPEDVILIHDAARPFVSPALIKEAAQTARTNKACTLATRVIDTLKYESGAYVDRDNLWQIQTPQAFHYGLIKQAHEQAHEQASPDTQWTDDTSMVEALGHKVHFIESSTDNFKITTSDDLKKAERMLSTYETRTGTGFDVHAFDTETAADSVRIGGIDIPHGKKLKGHSDADVALHTITDALLGAIGEGDIGLHFPPSDDQWKGKDSAFFLQKAVDMLGDKDGKIVNIDLTIICEAPKLGAYRDQIRARVAEICAVDRSRVNIKGTTTEKLGFTGRGEGIAAQAVVNVKVRAE